MLEEPDFESPVERTIRQAVERGEFDNLPGAGQPLPGAGTRDDDLWWVRGWLRRQRQLEATHRAQADFRDRLGGLWLIPHEAAVRATVEELNAALPHGTEPLDIDEVLRTWRAMSRARRGSKGADRSDRS